MSDALEIGDYVTDTRADQSDEHTIGLVRVVLDDLAWITWSSRLNVTGKWHTVEALSYLAKVQKEWETGVDYLRKQALGLDRTYHVVHVFENGDAIAWYKVNLTEKKPVYLSSSDRDDYRVPSKVPGEVNVRW